jgi:hypothetical protein
MPDLFFSTFNNSKKIKNKNNHLLAKSGHGSHPKSKSLVKNLNITTQCH